LGTLWTKDFQLASFWQWFGHGRTGNQWHVSSAFFAHLNVTFV
jgi:hypothetical protein